MRLLKSAVCLVMLSAGIAAVPTQLAEATAPPSAKADDASLVREMKAEAKGSVTTSAEQATGKVGFIRAKGTGADLLPATAADDAASAGAKADAYLKDYSAAFGAGTGELKREEVQSSDFGWTVNYTQTYKGLPVFGSLLRAHLDKQGHLTAVNGYAAPDLALSATPRKSASAAADRALSFVRSAPGMTLNDRETKALKLKVTSNDLMVYRVGSTKGLQGPATLAYVVEVTDEGIVREKVFVDANSGKILNRYSMVDNALDRELYEAVIDDNGTPDDDTDDFLTFVLVWAEGDDLDAECTADPCADTLNVDQRNLVLSTGESYWFFKNSFNRDSYDGEGATMRTVNNDPRIDCPNANWNGVTTNYCDGVTSDDVVSHEWGHAYTEYTHGLIYQWQSGALNESYSDVWGETVDLINNREDEGEGDISGKRPVGQCSTHSPASPLVTINAPSTIARDCVTAGSAFGPQLDDIGITGDLVLGLDADEDADADPNPFDLEGSVYDGCSAFTNGAELVGKIVMVNRGLCGFEVKARNIEAAGGVGAVIANRDPAPFAMSGDADPDPTISSVMIGLDDRTAIANAIEVGGADVNITMKDASGPRTNSYRWLIGEKSSAFGGAIRDMWNPNCYGDPGKVSDAQYVCSTDDGGGVHSNSGVPNHGYSLLVDGGTFNGVTVNGIGLTKAAHIYYKAMNEYQTPVSDFADHADSLAASCQDLIGKGLKELNTAPNSSTTAFNKITAADCAQVDAMAQAVELRTEPVQCDFGPQLDPNTPAICGEGTGEVTAFEEDFEGGLDAWTLSEESVFGGPTANWKTTSDLPQGNKQPGNGLAALGPAPDQGTCSGDENDFSSANFMTSPEITLSDDGSSKLVFDHNIQTEVGYDGGTVLVSVNGGDFTPVEAGGYLFNGPTVLASEAAGSTNPLAGLDGFTGTDGGKIVSDWGTSIIDLDAVGAGAGDTIQVQFAIGRDGCGGVVGWYVDNVRVISCVELADATVAAAHVPNPSTYGQAHSVNVTVSGGAGTPTGEVTLMAGSATLGSAPLNGAGAASIALPKALAAGTYNLTAEYSGDDAYGAATQALTGTVVKASPTVTAKANPGSVPQGREFKSTVKVKVPGGVATGKVIIKYKGKKIGHGTLVNGRVVVTLDADFPVGSVTLQAKYLGDANNKRGSASYDLKVSRRK